MWCLLGCGTLGIYNMNSDNKYYAFSVDGCPVVNGRPPCPRCGGGWPGTKMKTDKLNTSIQIGNLDPSDMGCLPLEERVRKEVNATNEKKSWNRLIQEME